MNDLTALKLDFDTLLDLENIAIGAFSPLRGFMDKEEILSVADNMRLPSGTPWTIPITLTVSKEQQKRLPGKGRVEILSEAGDKIGYIDIRSSFSLDKETVGKKIYATDSTRHPGFKKWVSGNDIFISGPVSLEKELSYKFKEFNLQPDEVKKLIRARGWKTVAGFQTRNVPHLAHEFLQKTALSITDGILLHPIIGWKKEGDFNAQAVIKAYQILINHYYPEDSAIFSGFATAMRYAGPREAIFHALVRKNYGCTHFIVGRDHAGVGGFYDKYAAHRIFDELPDTGIIPLKLHGPFHCTKCKSITTEKLCPHEESERVEISGTEVREMVKKRIPLPDTFVRKEIRDLLMEYGPGSFI